MRTASLMLVPTAGAARANEHADCRRCDGRRREVVSVDHDDDAQRGALGDESQERELRRDMLVLELNERRRSRQCR